MSISSVHTNILPARFFSTKLALLDDIFRMNLLQSTNSSMGTSTCLEMNRTSTKFTTNELAIEDEQQMIPSNIRDLLSFETQKYMKRRLIKGGTENETAAVNTVIDFMVGRISMAIEASKVSDHADVFTCGICFELLQEPITLKCGHSLCKECIPSSASCWKCNGETNDITNLRVNVLLSSTLEKLHRSERIGRSLIIEGDELLEDSPDEAIIAYTKAMHYVHRSHKASLKRSQAFAAAGDLVSALTDITIASTSAKFWPEAHYQRAAILRLLGKNEEAFISFLICVALDPTNVAAKQNAKATLDGLLRSRFGRYLPSFSRKRERSEDVETGENPEVNDNGARTLPVSKKTSTNKSGKLIRTDTAGSARNVSKTKDEECKHFNEKQTSQKDLNYKGSIFVSNTSENPSEAAPQMESKSKHQSSVESHQQGAKSDSSRESNNGNLMNPHDFDCSLCMRLFHQPVCTPCGHLFCRGCIERCLDHGSNCPLCNHPLAKFINANQTSYHPSTDVTTQAIIRQYFPEEYARNETMQMNELEKLKESTPIFVCTVAFPSVPCPLHVYEPKYRLMLRRAMEIHDNEFGMCLKSKGDNYHEVGTMLRIKDAKYLPDGRAVMQSVGTQRFEVVHRDNVDGYHTAQVRYIVDEPVENPEDVEMMKKILNAVYSKSKNWYQTLDESAREQIREHYGAFPENDYSLGDNGPDWTWFVMAILPVDDKIRLTILRKKHLRERLLIMSHILKCLNSRHQNQ